MDNRTETGFTDWTALLWGIPELLLFTFPISAPLCFFCMIKLRILLEAIEDRMFPNSSDVDGDGANKGSNLPVSSTLSAVCTDETNSIDAAKENANATTESADVATSTKNDEQWHKEQIDAHYRVAMLIAHSKGFHNMNNGFDGDGENDQNNC